VLLSAKSSCEGVVIYLLELSAGSILIIGILVCSIISFIYYYLGRLAFLSLDESVLFKFVELLYVLLLLAGVVDEVTIGLIGANGLIGGVIIVYSYYFGFEY